jgi:F-type H+-transporting ATPase subunit gamma
MARARRHVEETLAMLEERQRVLRQEEITAEVVELAAGRAAFGGG